MTNDLDIKTIRKSLDAMRARHGADTPIGHRCSNLIEMMKNRETATPDLRRDLDKYITAAVEDLARLGRPTSASVCYSRLPYWIV